VQNIAYASGDSASQVQDDAWVFIQGSVQGGNVNLVYSKRAWNDTKNADATSQIASREDYITYTLTATNSGNSPANSFIITDDLSQVLPYADMVDNGGGVLSGNVISFPGITIPANGSVSKSFKVRVKFSLASNLSYSMVNTYGNTITVRINTPQVLGAFVAPKTGGPTVGLASIFGSLMAGGLAVIRNRRKVWELLWD
jgi:fimbrial isopeptide formation D2 family protein